MSNQEQSLSSPIFEERTVVDADVHVEVPTEEMAAFADEPVRSRLLNSYAFPVVGGSDWDPTMGGEIEPDDPIEGPDEVEGIVRDGLGIEQPILNPVFGLGKVSKPELAVDLMRARNEAFAATYLDGTDFRGLGVITAKAPDAVAEEIDRLGDEDGIVGVVIECLGERAPLGDPSLDPVYSAAEDNGLPVVYHTKAAGNFMYSFPTQDKGVNTFLEAHTLAHLWGPSLALTSLLVQGVPEKFPDLEFVFLESGASWVPHLVGQLNRAYARRNEEAPLLRKPPEEYVREQFYFATQPLGELADPDRLRGTIDAVGVDSLVFATDYPHWNFDDPDAVGERFAAVFDPEERERILETTPAEVFGLDV